MVVEQVSDGYKQAISIKEDSDGIVSLVVLLDIALSRPRSKHHLTHRDITHSPWLTQ